MIHVFSLRRRHESIRFQDTKGKKTVCLLQVRRPRMERHKDRPPQRIGGVGQTKHNVVEPWVEGNVAQVTRSCRF